MVMNMYENCKVIIINTENGEQIQGIIIKQINQNINIKVTNSINLNINSEVHIRIYHEIKGEITGYGTIYKILSDRIILSNFKIKNTNQRRKRVRVPFNTNLKIWTIDIDEKKVPLQKYIGMKSINISATGILLTSILNINKNIKVHLKLKIINKIIDIKASIVRKKEKDELFYYGCEFVNISEKNQDIINKYVFEEMKNQISSSNNN